MQAKAQQLELNVLLLEKHLCPEILANSVYAEIDGPDEEIPSNLGIEQERLEKKQRYMRFRKEIKTADALIDIYNSEAYKFLWVFSITPNLRNNIA